MSFLDMREQMLDDETKARPKTKETIDRTGVISTGAQGEEKYAVTPEIDIDKAYTFIKKTPEALAMANAIVEDALGFGLDYQYVGRQDTPGTHKIKRAKRFWERGFHMEAEASLVDLLIAGRTYIYLNDVGTQKVKSAISEYIDNNYDFNYSDYKSFAENYIIKKIEDEDLVGFNGAQHVPASTIEHELNEYGDITKFVQKIWEGDETDIEISPEKMIHIPFMQMNGETYGFSPIISTFTEMSLIGNVKDYQGNIFKNAGVVNKLFTMEEAGPKSQNYKHLMKTMRKFRNSENQHKDLVLTGNVDVEDLNSFDSEMDFKELSEYLTRVIVMAWGVPPSRIGIDVSGNNSARSASLNQQGYYKKIRRLQSKFATILNNELFEPYFDVRISFKNPDIKTEVKMADRDLRKTEVVKQMVSMGLWGVDKAMNYMGVELNDLPDGTNPDEVDEETFRQTIVSLASNKNNLMNSESINQDIADEEAAQDKRTSANNN